MSNSIDCAKDYRVSGRELFDLDNKIRSVLQSIRYLAKGMSDDLSFVQSEFESVVKMTARFGLSAVRISEIDNDFARTLHNDAFDLAHTPIDKEDNK